MSIAIWLFLWSMVCSCHSFKLPGNNNSNSTTSPTISVQRFRSSTFYNYVKLTSTEASEPGDEGFTTESSVASSRKAREGDGIVFIPVKEDDADELSTQNPTAWDDVPPATEQSSPSDTDTNANASNDDEEDAGATSNQEKEPDSEPASESSGSNDQNTEASAPEGAGEPADPVPGQPNEDALENSEDSSESDSSSSSSSSEEFLVRKTHLKQKYTNELISKHKAKDSFRDVISQRKAIKKNRLRKIL